MKETVPLYLTRKTALIQSTALLDYFYDSHLTDKDKEFLTQGITDETKKEIFYGGYYTEFSCYEDHERKFKTMEFSDIQEIDNIVYPEDGNLDKIHATLRQNGGVINVVLFREFQNSLLDENGRASYNDVFRIVIVHSPYSLESVIADENPLTDSESKAMEVSENTNEEELA